MAGGVGGLGIIGVLIALLLGGGGDGGLSDLLGQLGANPQPAGVEAQQPEEFEGIDESEAFVRNVLGSTETTWSDVFAASGEAYPPAPLVRFGGSTSSACGGATSAVGPHYCPPDRTIYIDLDFFAELERRFGAGAETLPRPT